MAGQEKRPRSVGKIVCLIILAALLLPVGLFFAAGAWVNRNSIPAELLQPPPDLAKEIEVSRGWTNRSPGAPPGTPQPKTYTDYLKQVLREDPRQEGARLYLEVQRKGETLRKAGQVKFPGASFTYDPVWEIYMLNSGRGYDGRSWNPGEPLWATTKAWLEAHADAVALCLRFAENPSPLFMQRERLPRDQPLPETLKPDISTYSWCLQVLSAEMQRRMGAGDRPGADRIGRGILHLIKGLCDENLYHYTGDALLHRGGLDSLKWMMEHDVPTSGSLGMARTDLAWIQHVSFKLERVTEALKDGFIDGRRAIIQHLQQPWNADQSFKKFYRQRDYRFDLNIGPLWIPDVPRVDRMFIAVTRAMNQVRQYKSEGPRWLREFDDYTRQSIALSRMSYPEIATAPVFTHSKDNIFGEMMDVDFPRKITQHSLVGRTQLQLVRAAVEWRLRPGGGIQDPQANLRRDPDNPWRDPFTERPLRVSQTTSGTLIYSLGPDMKDQGGQVEYNRMEDWSNKNNGGDLTIRLKAK